MSLILNSNTISKLVFNGINLSQVVFNGISVWSSQIGIFFMGLRFRPSTTNPRTEEVRLCTRIDIDGNMVGVENELPTSRSNHAGTSSGNNALFFGGLRGWGEDLLTMINKEGSEIVVEWVAGTSASTNRAAANSNNVALFFGGTSTGGYMYNTLTRFNTSGNLISNTNITSVTPDRTAMIGMSFNSKVSFYGGASDSSSRLTDLINMDSDGAVIGSTLSLGRISALSAASSLNNKGLIFGGVDVPTGGTPTINKMLILENDAITSDNSTLATARRNLAGCAIGPVATFYGGYTGLNINTMTNTVSRFNDVGVMIGVENSVGSQTRSDLAAASAS